VNDNYTESERLEDLILTTPAELRERVCQVLFSQFCITKVSMTDRLKEDLDADSLDKIELGLYLEEEFDIEFDPDDLDGVETVQDLIQFVDKKVPTP